MKSTAELVVHAASRHRLQSLLGHGQHRRVAGSPMAAQQEIDQHRLRKLGCTAEPTVGRIMVTGQSRVGLVQQRGRQRPGCQRNRGPLEIFAHLRRGRLDLADSIRKRVSDRGEDASERRHAEAIARWEIRAGKEWRRVRQQEGGHRPAARAGHGLDRAHVDLVQVRPLFPVDLDGDEVSVDQRGDLGVFEGFASHHVAPVTGAVTDAEQDRFVLAPGSGQRFRAPGVPVDRIVRVL